MTPWTDDEDRVLWWASRRGIGRKVIARPLGRTPLSVKAREYRLGIRRSSFFQWNAGLDGMSFDFRWVPVEVAPPIVVHPTLPTLREILVEVAADYGVEASSLLGKRHPHAAPRHDFMARARGIRWPDGRHRYSLQRIADFLGCSNHTSVRKGLEAHAARMNACEYELWAA